MCELEAPDFFHVAQARQGGTWTPNRPTTHAPSSVNRRKLPHQTLSIRIRRTDMSRREQLEDFVERWLSIVNASRASRRLDSPGGLLRRRRYLRLEHRAQRGRHVRRHRRDPRHRARPQMAGLEGWNLPVPSNMLIDERLGEDRRFLETVAPGRGSSERRKTPRIYESAAAGFGSTPTERSNGNATFFDFGHVQKSTWKLMSARGSCRKACAAPHRA